MRASSGSLLGKSFRSIGHRTVSPTLRNLKLSSNATRLSGNAYVVIRVVQSEGLHPLCTGLPVRHESSTVVIGEQPGLGYRSRSLYSCFELLMIQLLIPRSPSRTHFATEEAEALGCPTLGKASYTRSDSILGEVLWLQDVSVDLIPHGVFRVVRVV